MRRLDRLAKYKANDVGRLLYWGTEAIDITQGMRIEECDTEPRCMVEMSLKSVEKEKASRELRYSKGTRMMLWHIKSYSEYGAGLESDTNIYGRKALRVF